MAKALMGHLVSDPQLAVQVVALRHELPLWKQSSRNCAHKQLLSCRIRWNCAISTMNLLIWVAPRLHWLRPDLGRVRLPLGSSPRVSDVAFPLSLLI